jgi:hypothetical protein
MGAKGSSQVLESRIFVDGLLLIPRSSQNARLENPEEQAGSGSSLTLTFDINNLGIDVSFHKVRERESNVFARMLSRDLAK